tara:strand:- start:1241 stop:1825 length:585 start_codon:yes stop_codon:yes gene_type:complete
MSSEQEILQAASALSHRKKSAYASKRSRSKESEPLPYKKSRPTTPAWLKRCREGTDRSIILSLCLAESLLHTGVLLPSNVKLFLSNNGTGFKNVAQTNNCFTIKIKRNGKSYNCGTFITALDAAIAYATDIEKYDPDIAKTFSCVQTTPYGPELSEWTCKFCGDKTYGSRDALRKHCRKDHFDDLLRDDRFWKE